MHVNRRTGLLAALLLVHLLVAGCGRNLMPTPALYASVPYPEVVEARRSNMVDILYATDRVPEKDTEGELAYGAQRSTSIAIGRAQVRIGPPEMAWEDVVEASQGPKRSGDLALRYIGAEELIRFPRWPWYQNLADDPEITEPEVRAEEAAAIAALHDLLAAEIEIAGSRDVYVFVHGFNNPFDYAACSMAELWHFAGRPGVPILYSWPAARQGIFGYDPDRESSEFTVSHLKMFLEHLAAAPSVERVNVIAHSRGTDVLGTALRELQIKYLAQGLVTADELKLHQVVFAAADIDMEVSSQRLGGERVVEAGQHMTIYTSAGDRALGMSAKMFDSKARLGQAGPDTLTPQGQATLGMVKDRLTVVYQPKSSSFFGHSYFLNDPGVSSDLILVLRDGRLPGAEHGRPLVADPTGLWVMPENYLGEDQSER